MNRPLATVAIRDEQDVVHVRQRARLIAELLGFDRTDQTRVSTAVSEIARNGYHYAGGGEVTFALDDAPAVQTLTVTVRDQGPGIADLEGILAGSPPSPAGEGGGPARIRSRSAMPGPWSRTVTVRVCTAGASSRANVTSPPPA